MVRLRSSIRKAVLGLYSEAERNSTVSRARFARMTSQRCVDLDDRTRFMATCTVLCDQSRAQLFQDLWVVFETSGLKGGYFVEFGADDGQTNSNTWLLEESFGWSGILAEPNLEQARKISKVRNCVVDERCVWSEDGVMLDLMVQADPQYSSAVAAGANPAEDPALGLTSVESVSLDSLLKQHDAPKRINYLSIDVEGAELQIIESFDWTKWQIDLVSLEHNGRDDADEIDRLMFKAGFERRFREISHFDGWYRHRDLATVPGSMSGLFE